jgi:hypothetical protein
MMVDVKIHNPNDDNKFHCGFQKNAFKKQKYPFAFEVKCHVVMLKNRHKTIVACLNNCDV